MGRNNQQRRRAKASQRRARGRAGETFVDRGSSASPHGVRATTDAEQARRLVTDLMSAVAGGHPEPMEAALGGLADVSSAGMRRQQVARVLGELLHQRLTWAWRHGWQPADVHRLSARTLGQAETSVLRDAMVTDLDRYAAASVDPRWFAQLREVGAQRWWAPELDALRARAGTQSSGWTGVCEHSARLLNLLATLPALEIIGPLPGEATRSATVAADHPQVAERILTKVRQLLAKAESTTFEAEAETFTAGAQAMMARHSIDAAMLQVSRGRRTGPQARRIGIDPPYEPPKAMLLTAVAEANRCRTVWARELGFVTVLGFEADLEAVETLFTSLLVQSTQAMQREGSRRTYAGGSRTRSFRSSFLSSYAARIGERLQEVTDAETAAAAGEDPGAGGHDAVDADVAGRHPGGELVRVLAERSSAVDEAVTEMFPNVRYRRGSRPRDLEGWTSGRAAADRASLGAYERVDPGSPSRAG